MGRGLAALVAGLGAASAGVSYSSISIYINSVQSVRDQILYRAPEITQQVIKHASEFAIISSDQTSIGLGIFTAFVAGFCAVTAYDEFFKDKKK